MSTAALGTLQVTLDLDGGKFSGQIQRSGKVIRQFESDLNRVPRGAGNAQRGVDNLGDSFSRFTRKLVAWYAAFQTARLMIAGFGKSVIGASASLERMTTLLAGMSDAADEAGKLADARRQLEQITELAKTTPFSIDAITDAWVKFKSGGIDPANGSLKSLLDALASLGGSSAQLERASVAIQQMAGKGVISMEELRQQLGEAIPTAMRDLATATGMSVGQLSAAIASGSVESKEALGRLFAQWEITFGGSAQRMMDTFGGKVAKMKTGWTQLAQDVGKSSGLFDTAKRAIDQVIESFKAPAVRQFAISIAQGIGSLIVGVAKAGQAFITYSRAILVAGAALSAFLVTTRILIPTVRALGVATLALTGATGFGALAASLSTAAGASAVFTAALARVRIALAALVTAGGVFTITLSVLAALAANWYLNERAIKAATAALRDHGVAMDEETVRVYTKRLADLRAETDRYQKLLASDDNRPAGSAARYKRFALFIRKNEQEIANIEDIMAKQRAATAKGNDEARTEQDLAEAEKRYKELIALLSKPYEPSAGAGNAFVEEWEAYFDQLKERTRQMKADMRSSLLDDRESYFYSDLTSGLLDDIQNLNLGLITNTRERAEKEIEIEQQKVAAILRLNNASAEQIANVQNLLAEKTRLMRESMIANQPLNRLLSDWQNYSERLREASVSWLDGASDQLAEFITTGKARFRDFAQSIIKELVKIQLQKQLAGIIDSFIGSVGNTSGVTPAQQQLIDGGYFMANGGVIDGKGLRKYAEGGIASRPQVAVFGEGDTPEAFVPLPDGRTIPVTLSAAGKSESVAPKLDVKFEMVNNTGQPVEAKQGASRFDGKQYVQQIILEGVSRPGGFRDGMRSALR